MPTSGSGRVRDPRQQLQRRGVDPRVARRHDPPAAMRRPAPPVGHDAAGRLDHALRPLDVVGVAAPPRSPGRPGPARPARRRSSRARSASAAPGRAPPRTRRARPACRSRERSCRAPRPPGRRRAASPAAVSNAAAAQHGPAEPAHEPLADIGLVDHPEHRPVAGVEPDQHAPGRRPAQERARAVDRIEHPGQPGRPGVGPNSSPSTASCGPDARPDARASPPRRRGRPASPGRSPVGGLVRRRSDPSLRNSGRHSRRRDVGQRFGRPPELGRQLAARTPLRSIPPHPKLGPVRDQRPRVSRRRDASTAVQATSLSTRARSNSRRRCASGIE